MPRGDFNPSHYWEERLKKNYNLTGVGYLPMGEGFNRWMYKVRSVVFRRHMLNLDLSYPEIRALDIGSGTGFYIRELELLGVKDITGADLTKTATENLRKTFPEHAFYQADISEATTDMPPGPYDLVTCFDVLFHIVDDQKYASALDNISNLTAVDGYFVFSDNLTPERQVAEHHISRTEDEVRNALRAAGFEVAAIYPMFYLMNAPVSAGNTAANAYWKGLQKISSIAKHVKLDYLIGALIYPFELMMLKQVERGISTKLLICTKTS